jgi:hypothetical protein
LTRPINLVGANDERFTFRNERYTPYSSGSKIVKLNKIQVGAVKDVVGLADDLGVRFVLRN